MGKVGSRSALMMGAAAVSFGAAAGVAAMGVGYAANRAASTIGGGKVFEGTTHNVLGRNIPGIPKFSLGMQWGLGVGALGAGAAQGAYQAGGEWDVNHAISTGMMEVERPHFLGATGSLTIASSRRGRGRAQQEEGPNYSRMAAVYGDDAFHLMRAVTGH
jgi:hypothetical protein